MKHRPNCCCSGLYETGLTAVVVFSCILEHYLIISLYCVYLNFEKLNHSERFMLAINAPLLICCILDYTIRKLLKSGGNGIDKLAVCTGDVNFVGCALNKNRTGVLHINIELLCK
jgi:hypothetical protein